MGNVCINEFCFVFDRSNDQLTAVNNQSNTGMFSASQCYVEPVARCLIRLFMCSSEHSCIVSKQLDIL